MARIRFNDDVKAYEIISYNRIISLVSAAGTTDSVNITLSTTEDEENILTTYTNVPITKIEITTDTGLLYTRNNLHFTEINLTENITNDEFFIALSMI